MLVVGCLGVDEWVGEWTLGRDTWTLNYTKMDP